MKLTQEEVEHLAHLARLSLTSEEKVRFSDQLSSILDYVGQLQKVDTSSVVHMLTKESVNVVRPDQAHLPEEKCAKDLVLSSPEHEGGFVTTKAVFSTEGGS